MEEEIHSAESQGIGWYRRLGEEYEAQGKHTIRRFFSRRSTTPNPSMEFLGL